jgi:riboflavin kinase/FMN adenylyltransferase
MAIYRHTTELPDQALGAVVAIGNFDGVHRGHQAVIDKAVHLARDLKTSLGVLTFEPHPRRFFRPDDPPFQLTSFRLKLRLLEALGVDDVFVLPFNRALSELSAEDFVRRILVEDLRARHVLVGDNFFFGHQRGGDTALLERLGREHGFGVTIMGRVEGTTGEAYSSTGIRDYMTAGNPTRAALLLGRYWEIEGRVQSGAKLGRKLGFPTANIALGEVLEPAYGVYAVRAGVDRGGQTVWHPGVANLGIRPMVEGPDLDSREPLLEVHLFDFDEDLYGQHMRVALVDYLRPEMTFDDMAALKVQKVEDSRRARVILDWEDWDPAWPASPFMSAAAVRVD